MRWQTRYYHGGPAGLTKILPPSLTGAIGLAPYGTAAVARPDRVYVTTNFTAAAIYAAGDPSGRGVVYEVSPTLPLEDDPDCKLPGLSYACRSAKVLRVTELSDTQRQAILSIIMEQTYGQ